MVEMKNKMVMRSGMVLNQSIRISPPMCATNEEVEYMAIRVAEYKSEEKMEIENFIKLISETVKDLIASEDPMCANKDLQIRDCLVEQGFENVTRAHVAQARLSLGIPAGSLRHNTKDGANIRS